MYHNNTLNILENSNKRNWLKNLPLIYLHFRINVIGWKPASALPTCTLSIFAWFCFHFYYEKNGIFCFFKTTEQNKTFWCIGSYDKRFCTEPWQQFANFITKTRLFKYTENFTTKTWKFSNKKKILYFSYFCSKHKLWIRRGGSNEYYKLTLWEEIRKLMYTPVNPSFTV